MSLQANTSSQANNSEGVVEKTSERCELKLRELTVPYSFRGHDFRPFLALKLCTRHLGVHEHRVHVRRRRHPDAVGTLRG